MAGGVLIRGGQIVDPANERNGHYDVLLHGSRIAEVDENLRSNSPDQVIDATGCLVIPGLVDTHMHLSQPFGGPQGHRMLARAGVTCALDMAGEADSLIAGIKSDGAGITIGYVFPLIPGETVDHRNPERDEILQLRDRALAQGALGVKVLGGHFPLTPEATALTIQLAAEANCWCAIHAGTVETGSDITGLEELIDLADGLPVHVAHVNSYCRGQHTGNPLEEASRAIAALVRAPQARSDSYLATINGANATIVDGVPKSNVVKTCLGLGGFPATASGMHNAILAGWAQIQGNRNRETVLLEPAEGLAHYQAHVTNVGVSFPVNPPGAAIAIALAKQEGEFMVTALSTDGGAIPRNTTLRQALALVEFGALTLEELVMKACLKPAQMFGLNGKGHLTPGADADIVVVDPVQRTPTWVLARGHVIVRSDNVIGQGGWLATTPAGTKFLDAEQIPHEIATPGWLQANRL